MFARPLLRSARRRLVVVAVAAVGLTTALAGCGDSPEAASPAEVLAEGGSVAHVTIGAAEYDFVVDCYDAGAGSVVVVGAGSETGGTTSGADTADTAADESADESADAAVESDDAHLFVQAFLGDSYVGVTIESDEDREEVFEASLDDALDLVLEDDVIEADDFTFVRNLDLDSGSGVAAGDGTLRVTCGRYEAATAPGQGS